MIEEIYIRRYDIIAICHEAAKAILYHYTQMSQNIEIKHDNSPVTTADKASNDILVSNLNRLFPHIPIISEESKHIPYAERSSWEYCFIIDPLDGTKEYLKRNNEFCINVALAHKQKIVAGFIYIPVTNVCYYAIIGKGAYKKHNNMETQVFNKKIISNTLTIAGSRSHNNIELDIAINQYKKTFPQVNIIYIGGAIKFGYLAEGIIDVYFRYGPTSEWDTAAGHIIIEEAGCVIFDISNQELIYNKPDLLNPSFIAKNKSVHD